MNTLIMNALGVKQESEVLAAIAKLKASGLTTNITNVSPLPSVTLDPGVLPVPDTIPDPLAAIQTQLTQIVNQNSLLMTENQRLNAIKDVAISKVEEVVQFKNEEILRRRRKTLNDMFHVKHKINPVQLAKAIKDFVDIEPANVPTTEDLYQLSLQVYETNEAIDGMETTTGLNPDGSPVLVESAIDRFDAEVDKVIKENGWNAESENDLNKAMDIVTERDPKLAQAYADESAPLNN